MELTPQLFINIEKSFEFFKEKCIPLENCQNFKIIFLLTFNKNSNEKLVPFIELNSQSQEKTCSIKFHKSLYR